VTGASGDANRETKDVEGDGPVSFLRHSSGVRWKTKAPEARPRGPDAPSAHRRPGYSLSGCTPAEPDSASPGRASVAESPVTSTPAGVLRFSLGP